MVRKSRGSDIRKFCHYLQDTLRSLVEQPRYQTRTTPPHHKTKIWALWGSCLPNSFRLTISTTVAPYAYSMLCNRCICEKLFFPRKLAWRFDRLWGSRTRSLFRLLICRRTRTHCSVKRFLKYMSGGVMGGVVRIG
jgi:hypothetical protein